MLISVLRKVSDLPNVHTFTFLWWVKRTKIVDKVLFLPDIFFL
jgi:hypothetical protein